MRISPGKGGLWGVTTDIAFVVVIVVIGKKQKIYCFEYPNAVPNRTYAKVTEYKVVRW